MSSFVFRNPQYLWLLLLIVPVLFYRRRLLKVYRRSISFPPAALLESLGGKKPWFPWISIFLLILAYIGIVGGLARPAAALHQVSTTHQGVAIILCVDISGSMIAEDFQPNNRIDVARTVIADFVEKRQEDRIGLITFAAMPFLRCPLTSDHKTLLSIVESLKTVNRGEIDGTAIGDALVASGKRLLSAQEKSRVVILLTDGENNRGQFDPSQAARILASHNMRVDVIGIGSKGVVPYPIMGSDGKKIYQYVEMGFNEESLKTLATMTNGVYYNATDAMGLGKVFEAINQLEKSKVLSHGYVTYEDYYPYPLGFALLCLVLEALWRLGAGRVFP